MIDFHVSSTVNDNQSDVHNSNKNFPLWEYCVVPRDSLFACVRISISWGSLRSDSEKNLFWKKWAFLPIKLTLMPKHHQGSYFLYQLFSQKASIRLYWLRPSHNINLKVIVSATQPIKTC